MEIHVEKLNLSLETPFKIAHGTSTARQNVLVHLHDGHVGGVGEADLPPYYPVSADDAHTLLTDTSLADAMIGSPLFLQDSLHHLPAHLPAQVRAALDIALHDRWAKHLGQPLYRLWGLNPAHAPYSSYTLGMETDETTYRARLHALPPYPIIKLKLGSGDLAQDSAFVRLAREILGESRQLSVDANSAWSEADAVKIIPQLLPYNLMYIEQPVAAENMEGWRALKTHLPADAPPLIADESVQGVESVLPLHGLVDGINIKLAKAGGLAPARQMMALARALRMKVMIGCMVSSSVSVTAAAHLAPLADFADLDGNLQVSNDPYQGVIVKVDGQIILPDAPGLGVQRHAH